MPRKLRMFIPGVPCHVIQRGNNQDVCFYCDDDYLFYLECLKSACKRYHVTVHAYILMTNHVHLLMQPGDEAGITRVMQSVGRRYVQYINRTYQRSGTLWEGRFKASLINAEGELNDGLKPHSIYLSLGLNDRERQLHYRDLFKTELESELLGKIRHSTQFSMPLGSDRFKIQIETALGRKIGHMKRGRPKIREKEGIYYK